MFCVQKEYLRGVDGASAYLSHMNLRSLDVAIFIQFSFRTVKQLGCFLPQLLLPQLLHYGTGIAFKRSCTGNIIGTLTVDIEVPQLVVQIFPSCWSLWSAQNCVFSVLVCVKIGQFLNNSRSVDLWDEFPATQAVVDELDAEKISRYHRNDVALPRRMTYMLGSWSSLLVRSKVVIDSHYFHSWRTTTGVLSPFLRGQKRPGGGRGRMDGVVREETSLYCVCEDMIVAQLAFHNCNILKIECLDAYRRLSGFWSLFFVCYCSHLL
jgi:hypothetical protein